MHEQLNTLFAQRLKCSLNAAVGMQQVLANYAIIAPSFAGYNDAVPCGCGVSTLANHSLAVKL